MGRCCLLCSSTDPHTLGRLHTCLPSCLGAARRPRAHDGSCGARTGGQTALFGACWGGRGAHALYCLQLGLLAVLMVPSPPPPPQLVLPEHMALSSAPAHPFPVTSDILLVPLPLN